MGTGSLRVIQNGAHFQSIAVIENMRNFSRIWPIRSHFHDSYVTPCVSPSRHDPFCSLDTHILATNSQETILFGLDRPDDISVVPAETAGFDRSPTLAALNVARRLRNTAGRTAYEDSSLVVQVTEKSVLLLEYDDVLRTHSVLTSWNPEDVGGEWAGRTIVAAALNPSQFVLGLSRKRLVLLNLDENNEFQIFRYSDSLRISVLHLTWYRLGIRT
jgi:DNA damage-binding protein 1